MKKVLAFLKSGLHPKVDEEPYKSTESSREPHRDPCYDPHMRTGLVP